MFTILVLIRNTVTNSENDMATVSIYRDIITLEQSELITYYSNKILLSRTQVIQLYFCLKSQYACLCHNIL